MATSPQRVSAALALSSLATGSAFGASLTLNPVGSGLVHPVCITGVHDGSGRLLLCERGGSVRVVADGALLPAPALTLTDVVTDDFEQGLLGIAVDPGFPDNGHVYLHWSAPNPPGTTGSSHFTMVARFTISSGEPNTLDPTSRHVVITFPQPFVKHNGGQIAFGPDGYLYIAIGDGGGGTGGDPFGRGQDLDTLLGKILRIDIGSDAFPDDPDRNYSIPSDNPFLETPVDDPATRAEIWAIGLRNPWRFSFDRCTGDLFVADVGQARWEEVNLEPAGSPGGLNYGWDCAEGAHPYTGPPDGPSPGCSDNPADFTLPILEYSHVGLPSYACAVIGGYRYRGHDHPELAGRYLLADYCAGYVWTAWQGPTGWLAELLGEAPFNITTFGEDERGELYVADYNGGVLYRLGADSGGIFGDGFECDGFSSPWSAVVSGP